MEKENLELVRSGLIIVDMINGFVNEGSLADPSINKIVEENVRIVNMFIEQGEPIFAFRDCHEEESREFESFPIHCLKGTNEVELIPELKVMEEDFIVIDKNSTSGFVVPTFTDYINSMKNLTELVITGCCTDICVMNLAIPLKNFFNQYNKNVEIIVPENAVDTYNIPGVHEKKEYNDMSFKLMRQAGINVVKTYEKKVR